MAGLAVGPADPGMTPASPGAAPPMDAAGAPPMDAAPGGQGQPASPEEQALYNRVVAMAMLAIYDDKMTPKLAAMLRDAPKVAEVIAEISANMAMRVYTHLKGQQTEVPGDVMMHAGKEIVEVVGELAEASGKEVSEQELETAFYLALDKFRAMAQQGGHYTEDNARADADEMRQMDESGMIEQIMAAAQQQQGPEQAPAPSEGML